MLLETTVSAGAIFGSEFLGTMILIILGVGVVANNLLPKTKGNPGPGSLQINLSLIHISEPTRPY